MVKVSANEIFRRLSEDLSAYASSAEGIALTERNQEAFLKREAARLAWEAATPSAQYDIGPYAFGAGAEREPPEALSVEHAVYWLRGYDDAAEEGDDEDAATE
jgi:hypothetical protein